MLSEQSGLFSPHTKDKPEQILQGAMQVFLQHGYRGTSMDRVAAQAGVSKHTIYNHFQGKEGLFVALIERLVLRRFDLEFPDCSLPLSEPPDRVLRRVAEIFLGLMDDPEYIAFIRLMIAESGRFPDLAQLYMRQVLQEGDAVLGEYFRSHPQLNLADPEMTTRVFTGALVSFILGQEVLHEKQINPIDKQRFVENLVAIVLCQANPTK
ncbi:TetR/AcrR family transcriptional regulator [Microcoleus sp. FACHB-1515]|uniref:TetR family transcriptional regulator n=1 Tax=Cyanophyceae TaxID=3028117 RepID=UPI001681DDA4|nr:TetR/AcrR family transcriptional regulator [Microcoleus sp. FACHB-1515]MBD2091812.1 TetR/AcrR family transcriptional regulator [Microcoleus sp. FACHB-1515]